MAEFSDPRVTVANHPLIMHKMSRLRSVDTDMKQFRDLVGEIAMLETYEATRTFELQEIVVTTPLCETTGERLARGVAVVPILRAGVGMLEGVSTAIPNAHVGFIGMQRNEETHEPEPYYQKLPHDIAEREVLLVDPMLATGGSGAAAVKFLRDEGVERLTFMAIVAAPEGLRTILDSDPDVRIVTCAIDDRLNDHAYIVPGLGDAGDRTFGTLWE